MWRIAFLVLVLIGALAAAIGLVVGVGAMQIARTNASVTSPTTLPAAVESAVAAVPVTPATEPAAIIPPPDAVVVVKPERPALVPPPPIVAKLIVDPIPAAAKEPARGPLAVTGFFLAKADGIESILQLTEGMTLDLATLPTQKYTIRAEVGGLPKSVRFRDQLGGNSQNSTTHIENAAPWTINGDGGGKAEPYALKAGDHLLAAAPYNAADAGGNMGQFLHLKFKVIDSKAGPIQLLASQATLKGEQIRLEGEGDDRAVAFWQNKTDSIGWETNVGKAGMYRVELTYSCDPQAGGGAFTVFLNSRQFGGNPPPTATWQEYRTLEVGQLALKEGDLKVSIKPIKIREGKALMNVRSLRLIPAD